MEVPTGWVLGPARAASTSAMGQPSVRRSSRLCESDSSCEAARLKVVKIQQALAVMGTQCEAVENSNESSEQSF